MLTDANIVTKNDEFEEEEAEMEVRQWSFDIRIIPKSHLMSRANLEELMERAVGRRDGHFWGEETQNPWPKTSPKKPAWGGQSTAPL